MTRILLFLLSLVICSAAWAEECADSMCDPVSEDHTSKDTLRVDTDGTLALDANQTYRTWLGERCIAFEPDAKLHFNWQRDLSFVGVPIFLSSFAIKKSKSSFRSARFAMNDKWKTEIDNYTQYSPYVALVGLKAFGYEGRSSWDRMLVSTLLSNVVMAAFVNSAKYTAREMRPDNSSRNSFPSGHTATAFAAATVLHKEYGLTRSPWFSLGGYVVAMGTGFARVLNNRHWISDVMSGAGIGIMSAEIGYFVADLIYRNKGIQRKELPTLTATDRPSFFDIQMGVGLHPSRLTATYDNGLTEQFQLGTSTAVGVEGAHFLNKHVGIGALARVTTTPTKGLAFSGDELHRLAEMNDKLAALHLPSIYNVNASNNNFIDASLDLGLYGNLPLSPRFSLGAKVMGGIRASSGFDFKARSGYRLQATDANGNYIYTGIYNPTTKVMDMLPVYVYENPNGSLFNSNETLMPGITATYNYHLDPSRYVSDEYAISKVSGGCTFNYILGMSATYRYKDNYSWRVFCDFDSAKNRYRYRFHLFDDNTFRYMNQVVEALPEPSLRAEAQTVITDIHQNNHTDQRFAGRMNFFTIGGAFSVNF